MIGRLIGGALHQARLHRQLVGRERAHENFVEQVIEAQEIERRRLAGDIHDGISQRLITLSYRLDAAARAVDDPDEAAEQLKARELVELTLQEARAAIGGSRPPVLDDLGLAGGLASLARSIPQIQIDVDLADTRLPEHIELALYRIAQECLQNVVKHANASTARLMFAVDGGTARLEIVDDGVGFTPSSIRSAGTRYAATACCRWQNAPSLSVGGSTSGPAPAWAHRSLRRSRCRPLREQTQTFPERRVGCFSVCSREKP